MKRVTNNAAISTNDQVVQQTRKQARQRRQAMLAAAAAALAGASLSPQAIRAATLTWAGTIADPSSPTYTAAVGTPFTNGQNLYNWDTTTANWTGAATTYTTLSDVVFTDNFAGGT